MLSDNVVNFDKAKAEMSLNPCSNGICSLTTY